ncbi:muramoyltetrapeptide carboxypeptidase [Amycolatopsis arida]|uniref:Muramoyltetrapeptide carboxypeptidase n=1 Tax=Amycolatopsis arida TaxID=587909 RepID=A0A1I5ZEP3_9PSEU|nr:LD-carboxypeptidase [Amycolatopsis arida]TDX89587.1 muramoyltetrapeptide carboxypeptidase [Amycolatopsis arida]SFQ54863.1 muramoyltetrapeptide carboxypeptidase [Amycolatopsis arida]
MTRADTAALVRPSRLRAGDTVAIVAPAGPVPRHLLDSAVGVLESWGLSVRLFDSVHADNPVFDYLAGGDAERARDFQDAWLDPDIRAVFAARGGYGCLRILDLVHWPALRVAGPKLFAGSSDTTALHEAVGVHLGLTTLFSPMPATAHFDPPAAEHLRRTLFEPERTRVLRGPDAATLVPGRAAGPVVGGNLSLLVSSIGAPEHRPARGGIAVLEDVTEDVYRLDRILTQLLRSGWFADVAGIALGSWTECGRPDEVRALMLDRLGPLGVPIVWELGFGHHGGALTVPLGVPAVLDADAATLTLTEPALS